MATSQESGNPASPTAEAESQPSETFTLISAHLGFIATITVTFVTVLKIGHETRWQTNTFSAALSSGSPFDVLVPIALVSGAMALTIASVFGVLLWLPRAKAWHRWITWNVFLFVVLFFAPQPLNVFLSTYVTLVAARDVRPKADIVPPAEQLRTELQKPRVRVAIAGLVVVLVSYAVWFGGMWLPAEAIAIEDGAVEVGYVIEENGSWTTVMVEHGRTLRRYPTDTITARTPCEAAAPNPLRLDVARFEGIRPGTGGQGDEPSCSKFHDEASLGSG